MPHTMKDLMELAGKTKAKILTRLRVDEISSVDRGAGEGVNIMLMKRNGEPPKKRSDEMTYAERIAKFYTDIFKKQDERKDFQHATAALAKSIASIEAEVSDPTERAELLAKTFEQYHTHINKLSVVKTPDDGNRKDDTMSPAVLKALGLKEGASEEEVLKLIKESAEALVKAKADLEKAKKPDKKDDDDDDDEDFGKSFDDLPEHVQKALKKSRDLQKKAEEDRKAADARIAKLESDKELESIKKIAVDAGMADSEAETIQKAYKGDKGAVDRLVSAVKAANAQAKVAGVWKEFGATGGDKVGQTALDQLNALAAEYRKAHPDVSADKAFEKVYTDPANRKLAAQERTENSPRAA